MKRIFAVFSVMIIAAALALTAFAAEDHSFKLKVKTNSNSFNIGDKITLTAAVFDIVDEHGIAVFDYHIVFDHGALSYVGSTVKLPELWEDLLSSDGVEDLSFMQTDEEGGEFRWVVGTIMENIGLKESNQFGLDITFEVLDNSKSTVIEFIPGHCTNDVFVDMTSNRVTVTLNSDEGHEEPSPVNSEVSGTVSQHTPVVDISGSYDIPAGLPGTASEQESDNSNATVIIIICGIAAAAIIITATVVIIKKRNKK